MLDLLPMASAIFGFIAAFFWGWSATARRPRFRLFDAITPDHKGDIPANKYFRKISVLNAIGAGCAAIAAACGALYSVLRMTSL
jgi:hypothetical protein